MASRLEEQRRREELNAGHANPDEAFERFIDGVVQLPVGAAVDPNCSWCNWRRGDSPRNLRLCGYHQQLRNNLRRV
jgi:hypothetical protein